MQWAALANNHQVEIKSESWSHLHLSTSLSRITLLDALIDFTLFHARVDARMDARTGLALVSG